MIDLARLKKHLPAGVLDELIKTATEFGINDPLVMSHFLGQAAHESLGFTKTTENLNYSATGLLLTFPKYFNGETAELYAHQPQAIASRVYADRMGNGPEDSNEGWIYRARGYLGLTGRDNYGAFDARVNDNILSRPELVATKYPMMSAGWYWQSRGLNSLASQGDTPAVVQAVTKVINGGKNGLDDRIKRFNYFYELLKYGTISN